MTFREKLYMFNEAFDSPQKIQNKYIKDEIMFYEFYIGLFEYRVAIEKIITQDNKATEINFERKLKDKWITSDVTNDLSKTEVMQVFSTVMEIGKKEKLFNFNYIQSRTNNEAKSRIYIKLFTRMLPNHEVVVSDDKGKYVTIGAYKESFSKSDKINYHFRYKK